jgi:hypothetical protein
VADIACTVPVVAELAVILNIPVPVYAPVLVIAKSAPVALLVGIETISLAVVGVRVVVALDQYPMAPDVGAVEVRFLEASVYTGDEVFSPSIRIVAVPAPELVRERVVFEPSTRLMV